MSSLLTAGIRQGSACLPAPHGSRVPDPVLNALCANHQESFPGLRVFTPSNSAKSRHCSKYAASERPGYAASEHGPVTPGPTGVAEGGGDWRSGRTGAVLRTTDRAAG